MPKHITPETLMRIGQAYVDFLATVGKMDDTETAAAARLDKLYESRFYASITPDGEDRPKRFFEVDTGVTYIIVAFDEDHAWVLFALEVARTECGTETEDATLREISEDDVARKHVTDERDGKEGRYPLASAEVGDVFCSEY